MATRLNNSTLNHETMDIMNNLLAEDNESNMEFSNIINGSTTGPSSNNSPGSIDSQNDEVSYPEPVVTSNMYPIMPRNLSQYWETNFNDISSYGGCPNTTNGLTRGVSVMNPSGSIIPPRNTSYGIQTENFNTIQPPREVSFPYLDDTIVNNDSPNPPILGNRYYNPSASRNFVPFQRNNSSISFRPPNYSALGLNSSHNIQSDEPTIAMNSPHHEFDESKTLEKKSKSKKKNVNRRLCSVTGCQSQARAYRLCKKHGGSKKCNFPGCTRNVQSRGLCIGHGGGSRCKFKNCPRAAQSQGLCKLHGGGRPCSVEGCNKKAHLKRLCRKHGGGEKCIIEGCNKWAQRHKMCMLHAKKLEANQQMMISMPSNGSFLAEL